MLSLEKHKDTVRKMDDFPRQQQSILFYRWLFGITVILFPVVAFISKRANDACFYLFLCLCFSVLFIYKKSWRQSFRSFFSDCWPLFLAMACPFVAETLNQLFVSGFRLAFFDLPVRFLLVPFLIYGLLNLPYEDLRQVRWGFMIGALACSLLFFYMAYKEGPRVNTEHFIQLRLINYANMTLLIGFLTFLTLGWNRADNRIVSVLKIIVFIAAIAVSLVSLTRGGWLAFPFFIWVGARFFKLKRKNLLVLCGIMALLFSSLFFFSSSIQSRFTAAIDNISQYEGGENKDTSVGIRFQHYRAGIAFFKKSPLFGIGRGDFKGKMQELAEENIISEEAARAGAWHLHNEFMYQLATGGILAALSVILFSLVPFCYFYRAVYSDDTELRAVACMGVTVSVAFFIFGLTEGVFLPKQMVNFYVFTLSILMTLLWQRRKRMQM